MGLIDLEGNSADERVCVITRLHALGIDLSKELLHAAQVPNQSKIGSRRAASVAFNEVRLVLFHARLAQPLQQSPQRRRAGAEAMYRGLVQRLPIVW